jgi:predicted phosphodiesterase
MKEIRYGIFSDIHSNMEALVAVLLDMYAQNVTHPICLGDIVGYNASPKECVTLVRTLNCPVIKGNHDEIVSGVREAKNFNVLAGEGITYSKSRLNDDEKTYLKVQPMTMRIEDFTVVHASLDEPENWNYITSSLEAETSFAYQRTQVCFIGHTHIPKVYIREREVREMPRTMTVEIKKGSRYLINVGAVGQPRDRDWRASYAIYTPHENKVEFRRVPYNLELAQSKIINAGLPEPLAVRLAIGA